MVAFRPGNGTARQTGGATALFHGLVQRGGDGLLRDCSDLKDGAAGVYHSGNDLRYGAIDIAAWQGMF